MSASNHSHPVEHADQGGGDAGCHRREVVATLERQRHAPHGQACSERAKRRVVVFRGLEVRPAERPQRVLVRVKLAFGEREAAAEEQGTDTVRNRVEAAARATATCLDELLPDNSIALEGASIIDAFERKFVLVAVHGLGGREAQLLTGTCEIRESAERSAVLAVLDATNRWVDARR